MQLDRRERKKRSVLPWGGHYGWQGWVFFMWQCALVRGEGFVFMTSANGEALAPLVCISCLVPSIALLLSFPGARKDWEISYQKDCGSLGRKREQPLNVISRHGVKGGKDTDTFYRFFFFFLQIYIYFFPQRFSCTYRQFQKTDLGQLHAPLQVPDIAMHSYILCWFVDEHNKVQKWRAET